MLERKSQSGSIEVKPPDQKSKQRGKRRGDGGKYEKMKKYVFWSSEVEMKIYFCHKTLFNLSG